VRRIPPVLSLIALVVAGSLLAAGSPAGAEEPPPAPTNVRQLSSSPTSVKVAWDADVAATSFAVAYSSSADFSAEVTKQTSARELSVSGLKANESYHFRVRVLLPAVSAWSEAQTIKTAQLLRIASFNIKAQDDSGSCETWTTRRPAVVKDILNYRIDVVGLQEVITGARRRGLLDAVNKDGAHYAMTFPTGDTTGSGNRLLYNTDRVELISWGDRVFAQQVNNKTRRVIWGKFRLKSNQQKFVVFTTHLEPGATASLTKSQWNEVLNKAKGYVPAMPTIVTGDFNTSKWNKPADSMLPAMKDAGMGDVLGQKYRSYAVSGQRAQDKTDAWINSFNDCNRRVNGVDKDDIGNNIDWIFASNTLTVPKWKTVAHYSGSTLYTPIASDHFMISAQFLIPLS
jgi:endonuclease/exonuclease/phosphatase family metal-dependent hydrolase